MHFWVSKIYYICFPKEIPIIYILKYNIKCMGEIKIQKINTNQYSHCTLMNNLLCCKAATKAYFKHFLMAILDGCKGVSGSWGPMGMYSSVESWGSVTDDMAKMETCNSTGLNK